MKKTHADPRRIPVHNGDVYCSPACGGGCTWATFQQVQRQTRRVAKHLGAGWESVVWENLGWCGAVKHAPTGVIVHLHDGAQPWATTTLGRPQFSAYGTTPRDAVLRVLRQVNEAYDRLAVLRRAFPT